MGLTTGLDALREKLEKAKGTPDFPKAEWFKLEDGQSARVRFAQEIDDQSPHYDEDRGKALIATEISNPKEFKKKCLSTLEDEGRCFGMEMHQRLLGTSGYQNGWKPKTRIYINVIVTNPDRTKSVQVLSTGLGAKGIAPLLYECAAEFGSITNREFKITRSGADFNNTSYTLMPFDPDKTPFDFSDFELYDLNNFVRHVPYDEQAKFFGFDSDGESLPAETENATSASVDW